MALEFVKSSAKASHKHSNLSYNADMAPGDSRDASGIAEHEEHAPSRRLLAQQSLEEALESHDVEDRAHPANELAAAQTYGAEASHRLAGQRAELGDGVFFTVATFSGGRIGRSGRALSKNVKAPEPAPGGELSTTTGRGHRSLS